MVTTLSCSSPYRIGVFCLSWVWIRLITPIPFEPVWYQALPPSCRLRVFRNPVGVGRLHMVLNRLGIHLMKLIRFSVQLIWFMPSIRRTCVGIPKSRLKFRLDRCRDRPILSLLLDDHFIPFSISVWSSGPYHPMQSWLYWRKCRRFGPEEM